MNNTGVSRSNEYCNADLCFNYNDRIRGAINQSDITTMEYNETRRIFKVQCPLLIDGSSMDGKLWIEY